MLIIDSGHKSKLVDIDVTDSFRLSPVTAPTHRENHRHRGSHRRGTGHMSIPHGRIPDCSFGALFWVTAANLTVDGGLNA